MQCLQASSDKSINHNLVSPAIRLAGNDGAADLRDNRILWAGQRHHPRHFCLAHHQPAGQHHQADLEPGRHSCCAGISPDLLAGPPVPSPQSVQPLPLTAMSTPPLLLTVLLLPAGGQSGSVSYEVSRVVRPRLAGIVRKSHCGCSQRRAPVNYNRYSRPSADRLMAPPRRSARLGDWGYKVIRLQTRDICSVPQFRCSRPKAS